MFVAFQARVDFMFPAGQDVSASVTPNAQIVASDIKVMSSSEIRAETSWEAESGVVAGAGSEGVADEADADVRAR